MFSTHLEDFLPFSSNSKLSSANYFSLEEYEICCLGKGEFVCTQLREIWLRIIKKIWVRIHCIKNVLCLVLQIFLHLAAFECNTTSEVVLHSNLQNLGEKGNESS